MFGARTQHRSRSRLRGMSRLIVATSLITSSFVAVTAANVAPSIAAPPTGMFTQISAGYSHTCAVDGQGAIWCWGSDSKGQLGNGATTGDQQIPVEVNAPSGASADFRWVQVSAGKEFTCAVGSNGKAYCWGDDATEQLGDGSGTTARNAPVEVQESDKVLRVDAGDGHACAVVAVPSSGPFVACWGDDASGQIGDGGTAGPQAVPVLAGTVIADSTSASSLHTCAVELPGTAACWGGGSSGQIGNGSSSSQTSPVAVTMPTARLFASIAGGGTHTCATATDGTAWCWGADGAGQLGNGVNGGGSTPSAVVMPTGKTFTGIDGGTSHTCAISADFLAYCWGDDAKGQVGNGSTTGNQATPVAVSMPSGKRFTTISTGDKHTCALSADGLAYCWGDDSNGQLGNGVAVSGDRTTPTAVTMPATDAGWRSVSAGVSHTCAIASDGTAWCWGSDAEGQLGDGSPRTDRSSPIPVTMPTGRSFTSISSGWKHTCAISSYGTAYCWGNDQNGQLGNAGAVGTQLVPSAVSMPSGKFFTQISAGWAHTCALASDGTAWCWGSDTSLQLGDVLTRTQQDAPVAVQMPAGKRFVQITVGEMFSCAIADDRSMYCWGSDANGQLGNGPSPSTPQPVPSLAILTGLQESSAGAAHVCSIGVAYPVGCSGSDASGQLGNGAATGNVEWAGTTASALSFIHISAGTAHTCAIVMDGSASCWGSDASGQLGTGLTASDEDAPVAVASAGQPYLDIDAGGAHTCATTAGGPLWCWGSDASGQIGDGGTATDQFEPVEIPTPYQPVTLTVVLEGEGLVLSGETGATPKKIDCPGDCVEAALPYGTTVTLTASAVNASWPFAGWLGGGCAGTGSCSVKLLSDTTVTARFGVLLTITKSTAAAGTVASNTSPGFTCDTSCASTQKRYALGTTVRITASPDTGYAVRSWTGCGTSSITTTPPSCSVSMSGAKTVSVGFGSQVRVSKNFANRGSIASTPTGISCGTACTTSAYVYFTAGSTVTFTATLVSPYTTVTWSDNCTPVPGSPKKCTLTVGSGPTTVNATIT